MTGQSGTCGRCGESRPVTPWQKDHAHLTEPDSWGCPFCSAVPRLLLCGPCTTVERSAEAEHFGSAPRSLGEQAARAWLRAAADIEEQRKAS